MLGLVAPAYLNKDGATHHPMMSCTILIHHVMGGLIGALGVGWNIEYR